MPIPRLIASRGDDIWTTLAVDDDLALVGLVEAVEDVHQRRLAGAVLAEQRMHLAAAKIEVDVSLATMPGKRLVIPLSSRSDGTLGSWPRRF